MPPAASYRARIRAKYQDAFAFHAEVATCLEYEAQYALAQTTPAGAGALN